MSIFKHYDIRGRYPEGVDEDRMRRIGRTFAEIRDLEGEEVAVGMDGRESSPGLKDSLVEGLVGGGCKVIDIGLVATPMLYFEVVDEDLSAGLMVTASHNPKEYNGVRLCGKKALDLTYETGIKQIEKNYEQEFEGKEGGEVVEKDVKDRFVNKVTGLLDISGGYKVVLDHGNGPSSLVGKRIFEKLGCEIEEINSEIDGSFPGRGPDPSKNHRELAERVRKNGADLGIAFDGDADRAFFLDSGGEVLQNDLILALFVKNFAGAGNCVVYDVKCSKALEDVIEEIDARKIMSRTGMSYVKRKLMEKDAKMGGEYSGHFFFRENDYYDDPFFAGGKLLEIMDGGRKISELIEDLPKYYSSEEFRPDCKNKEEVVEKIKEEYSDRRVVDIDGARIYFDGAWALVRTSSTEEKLSIRFEAGDEGALEKIKEEVMGKVEKYRKV